MLVYCEGLVKGERVGCITKCLRWTIYKVWEKCREISWKKFKKGQLLLTTGLPEGPALKKCVLRNWQ